MIIYTILTLVEFWRDWQEERGEDWRVNINRIVRESRRKEAAKRSRRTGTWAGLMAGR